MWYEVTGVEKSLILFANILSGSVLFMVRYRRENFVFYTHNMVPGVA